MVLFAVVLAGAALGAVLAVDEPARLALLPGSNCSGCNAPEPTRSLQPVRVEGPRNAQAELAHSLYIPMRTISSSVTAPELRS